MSQVRVCVLQSSYADSESPMKAYDDYDCTPAPFFTDPSYSFASHKISKAKAYSQIKELVTSGCYDVFLNLCDGAKDEDRAGIEVVEVLEALGAAYTGVCPRYYEPSKLDMKQVAYAHGILFPNYIHARRQSDLEKVPGSLKFPVIVKHPSGYSSVGMTKKSKCQNMEELQIEANRFIKDFGSVLIEEFIIGQEVTVLACETGIEGEIDVFPPIRVNFGQGDDFKYFDLKWIEDDKMQWETIGAKDSVLAQKCMEIGRKAFATIQGGVGYGRSDLRIDEEGRVYFLEVNSNCGLFYPKDYFGSADFVIHQRPKGLEDFTKKIIAAAFKRQKARLAAKPKWELSYAKDQGFFLQANCDISAGELVFPYEGQAFYLNTKAHVEETWSQLGREQFARYAWPLTDKTYVTWSDEPSSWRPLNHSCDPNLWFGDNHCLDIYARRAIATGEQLNMDYATFCGGDYMQAFSCNCHSRNCRKTIQGNDFKRLGLAEVYGSRISDYIGSF